MSEDKVERAVASASSTKPGPNPFAESAGVSPAPVAAAPPGTVADSPFAGAPPPVEAGGGVGAKLPTLPEVEVADSAGPSSP